MWSITLGRRAQAWGSAPAQLAMVAPSMSTSPEPLHGSPGRKPGTAHPAQLAELAHSKVVNAAYFSPVTGGKVLTTCIGAPLSLIFLASSSCFKTAENACY